MSYSLNSLKGGYIGDYIGDYYRGYKGDTRSLDSSSYGSDLNPLSSSGVGVVCLASWLLGQALMWSLD